MNAIIGDQSGAQLPDSRTEGLLRTAVRRILRNPLVLPAACLIGGAAALSAGSAAATLAQRAFPAAVDLTALLASNGGDGSEGFVVEGATASRVGRAGDVNGDQIDDVIVSGSSSAAYVVFGSADGFNAELPAAALDGSNGFAITGAGSLSRNVGGAGDFNGDGVDDVIVGSPYSTYSAYVVFGSDKGLPASIDVAALDGSNGFAAAGGSYTGASVASAGDVNGDGIEDLVIGRSYSSQDAYVLFGSDQGFPAQVALSALGGTDGFVMVNGGFVTGGSADGAGDVNGDGIDDVIVGGTFGSGGAYVVFGSANGFAATVDLAALDGSDGFAINGPSGWAAGAGDVNGDGFNDVMVADRAIVYGAGRTFVVYGRDTGFPAGVDALTLDGTDGFALTGPAFQYSSYTASAAGDINGDGVDDLSIGGNTSGPSYVVFGNAGGFPANVDLGGLDGTDGFIATGANKDPGAAGDVNADGFDDLIAGTGGAQGASRAYVLFGRGAAVDTDGDGVEDAQDNCSAVANAGQDDADGDSIGNACDPDINNDCAVNAVDLGLLKMVFFSVDPVADFNADGFVNASDLGIMKSLFGLAPGPSGVPNACDNGD